MYALPLSDLAISPESRRNTRQPIFRRRFLYPADVAENGHDHDKFRARVTGKLFYQDQFNIAIKDDDGWYHSWPTY